MTRYFFIVLPVAHGIFLLQNTEWFVVTHSDSAARAGKSTVRLDSRFAFESVITSRAETYFLLA
jgi:hypothetical protein